MTEYVNNAWPAENPPSTSPFWAIACTVTSGSDAVAPPWLSLPPSPASSIAVTVTCTDGRSTAVPLLKYVAPSEVSTTCPSLSAKYAGCVPAILSVTEYDI